MGLAGVALTQDFEGRVVLKDDGTTKVIAQGQSKPFLRGRERPAVLR